MTEDHTVVHVEGVQLDKKNLTFSVEKIMEGNRLNPSVRYVVMPQQKLNAVIAPDQADNKKLVWETNDGSVLITDQGGSVEVNQDSAWIQTLIAADEARLKENQYALSTASGSYPKNAWVQLGYNGGLEWYHFDEAGYMQTGWFNDQDGNRYFLHNVSDGTQSHMVTGWYMIKGNWFYFNPVSDGTRGSLYVNRNTPDGYTVGADGIWISNNSK